MALGLGLVSGTALGCVPGHATEEDPPGIKTRTVEFRTTDGETMVVIDGEPHAGGVRVEESNGTMVIVDEDGEVRRFPMADRAVGGMRADDRNPDASGPATLGIRMKEVREGVRVAGIIPDTPAARVGLRKGDLILFCGGARGDMGHATVTALSSLTSATPPGDRIRLLVLRDGRNRMLTPTLDAGRPAMQDDGRRGPNDVDSMESFAREMEAMIREMVADRFGDDEGDMSMEFDIEFEEESHHDRGSDHDSDRHDDHEGPWEEMFRHVEGMMEEAHHETASWMEEMAERSGHWSEEVEHRMNEFAEMTEGRMNEFAEAFERELQRIMERQDEGRRDTEMMFRERDLELRERGMEFQRNFGESGRKLQEQLQRFAEQHQRLAEENRRLNERVDRLEQAIRRMMSEGGPDRDRDDDRMRGRDSEDARDRSAERGRRGAERNANRNDRRGSDAGSDRPRGENQDRPRDRGGDRD